MTLPQPLIKEEDYGGQDVLLETFLSGREITVGIVGTGEHSKVICGNEYVNKDCRTFGLEWLVIPLIYKR